MAMAQVMPVAGMRAPVGGGAPMVTGQGLGTQNTLTPDLRIGNSPMLGGSLVRPGAPTAGAPAAAAVTSRAGVPMKRTATVAPAASPMAPVAAAAPASHDKNPARTKGRGILKTLSNLGRRIGASTEESPSEAPAKDRGKPLDRFYTGASAEIAPDPVLLPSKRYDLSGRNGRHGRHGSDASNNGGYYGERGRDGGHAGPAEAGVHGGRGRFRLSDPKGTGLQKRDVVRIDADLQIPERGRDARIDMLKVQPGSEIDVDAHGGDGGDGGNGGRGGRGARGRRGDDATRWSWGEDGGRGGTGGNGGDPTDGESPGDGGNVTFEVNRHDTDLMALVKRNLKAGTPGKHGRHGEGGRGGEGGPGGSSYSWTETRTETYTDSQGNTKTRTRYVHKSNPGGSRGPSGSRGRDSTARVRDGSPGKDGIFEILVLDDAGNPVGRYDEIYDVEFLGFTLESRNSDNIFEPGEEMTVSNIRVRNRPGKGRLPTPEKQNIVIYFESRGYLGASRSKLTIPKSLAPGEEFEFETDLKLRIRDLADAEIPAHGEAWTARQSVSPEAELTSVRQKFEGFESGASIEIRFPIEVTAIHGAHSMGRGESKRIFWKVKNVSGRTFGTASEIRRAIDVQLKRSGGEVSADQIPFTDANGNQVNLDEGFLKAIESLGPGESAMIEGKVELGDEAPLYSDAQLMLDLNLGRINDGGNTRRIQSRAFTVRVAQTYRKTHNSDILLITNTNSRRDEVEAWKRLAENLGMKADVWDLSLNGFMDLSEKASIRNNLLKDFEGKTVVMLNNGFETAAGADAASESVRAETFLAKGQFLKAAAAYAVNFLMVGNTRADEDSLLHSLLMPTSEVDGQGKDTEFSSPGVYIREVLARAERDAKLDQYRRHDDYTERADAVEVKKSKWWWQKPEAEELDAVAKETLTRIDQHFPTRRHIATPRFDPRYTERRPWYWLGLKKEWSLGIVEFRRTLDATLNKETGTAVGVDVRDGRMHGPEFVNSREAYLGFFLSLNMEQKLKAFNALFGRASRRSTMTPEQRRLAGEALVDAVLADIANEQAALRRDWLGWRLSRRQIRAKLRSLRYLTEEHAFGFRNLEAGTEEGDLVIRLAAGIDFLAKSQRLVRDYFLMFLPPFTRRNARVSGITRGYLKTFVKRMFPNREYDETDYLGSAWAAVKARVEEHKAAVKAVREATKIAKRTAAMLRMLSPLKGVTTDDELMLRVDDRVVSESAMERARRESERRDRDKKALESRIEEAKKALESGDDRYGFRRR